MDFAIFTFAGSSSIDDAMVMIRAAKRQIRGALDPGQGKQRWSATKWLHGEGIKGVHPSYDASCTGYKPRLCYVQDYAAYRPVILREGSAVEEVARLSYQSVVEEVKAVINTIIDERGTDTVTPELDDDTRLYDTDGSGAPNLDIDSLDALELITSLEERYDFELSDVKDLVHIKTVRDIANAVIDEVSKQKR